MAGRGGGGGWGLWKIQPLKKIQDEILHFENELWSSRVTGFGQLSHLFSFCRLDLASILSVILSLLIPLRERRREGGGSEVMSEIGKIGQLPLQPL